MAGKGRPTYAGNINNAGSQKVTPPVQANATKGKSTVKTGTDLRTGK